LAWASVSSNRFFSWVGDLRELLAEGVVERAHATGKDWQRSVVTHRANGLLAGLGEHAQHLVTLLETDLELLLVTAQHLLVERLEHRALLDVGRLERACMSTQPLLVGLAPAQQVTDLFRVDHLAGLGVGGEHLTRLQAAVDHHVGRVVIVDANLRRQRDDPVAGDDKACRAQAITVEDTGGMAAVGQHNPRRTVPRLHMHGVILMKGAHVGIHQVDVLPRRRDQQAHGTEDVHASGQHPLEHVVEAE